MTQTYRLSLIDPEGHLVAVVDAPTPVRFVHVRQTEDGVEATLCDDAEAPLVAEHVDTFARIGKAVWITDDAGNVESRDALYVLQTA